MNDRKQECGAGDTLDGVVGPATADLIQNIALSNTPTSWTSQSGQPSMATPSMWSFLNGVNPVGVFQGEYLYINRKDPARGLWFIDLPNGQGTLTPDRA